MTGLKPARTTKGAAMLLDFKSAVRHVFADHTMYTSELIVASLPKKKADANSVATRLMRNPDDIKNLLSPIISAALADELKDAFTEHLTLAASTLPLVEVGAEVATKTAVAALYAQGDDVATLLSEINPTMLPLVDIKEQFLTHNKYVVQLVVLRKKSDYTEYIRILDIYRAHMDRFADMLYFALSC